MVDTDPRYSYVIKNEWINDLSPGELVFLVYAAAAALLVALGVGYKIFHR